MSERIFTFLSLIWIIDALQQYCKNSEKSNKRKLLKICLQVTYSTDSA